MRGPPALHRTIALLALVAWALLAFVPTTGRLARGVVAEGAEAPAPPGPAGHAHHAGHHEGHHGHGAAGRPAEPTEPMVAPSEASAPAADSASHAGHASARPASAVPGAPRPHHGDGDCEYCPLLANLLVTAVLVALWTWTLRTRSPRRLPGRPVRWTFHPAGLGSRGPPPTL